MIQLFIDNSPVVLPKDFNLSLLDENPFFTKNGKSTYDIDIDLSDPTNAKIYQHCNRVNNDKETPKSRSARLVVDNQVLLNGTEIILEITDEKVSIQLVSGESELNYLVGSDKKIKDLELGSILDGEFEFLPFYSMAEDRVRNGYWIVHTPGDDYPHLGWFQEIRGGARSPYFYCVIEKILNALGFKISENTFRTGSLKYLLIVNGLFTRQYNTLLPDWSVVEFLSEVEKAFNVCFLVDDDRVSIQLKRDYYNNVKKTYIKEAIDSFELKIDDENREDYSLSNVGYTKQNTDYFKYQDVNSVIMEQISGTEEYLGFDDILSDISNSGNPLVLKNKIFYSQASETFYICYKGLFQGSEKYYPKKINAFAPDYNNEKSTSIDIELKIKPISMQVKNINVVDSTTRPNILYSLQTQIMEISSEYIYGSGSSELSDIQEEIENEIENEIKTVSEIFVVLYSGLQTIYEEDAQSYSDTKRKVNYPVPYVDYLWETNKIDERIINSDKFSLRLNHSKGMKNLYSGSIQVDTTIEYTFRFLYYEKIDIRSVFVIKNREFVCKELKYNVTAKGFDEVIEGVFYPLE